MSLAVCPQVVSPHFESRPRRKSLVVVMFARRSVLSAPLFPWLLQSMPSAVADPLEFLLKTEVQRLSHARQSRTLPLQSSLSCVPRQECERYESGVGFVSSQLKTERGGLGPNIRVPSIDRFRVKLREFKSCHTHSFPDR